MSTLEALRYASSVTVCWLLEPYGVPIDAADYEIPDDMYMIVKPDLEYGGWDMSFSTSIEFDPSHGSRHYAFGLAAFGIRNRADAAKWLQSAEWTEHMLGIASDYDSSHHSRIWESGRAAERAERAVETVPK